MSDKKKTEKKKEKYSIIKDRHLYPGKFVELNSSEIEVLSRYALIVSSEQYFNEEGSMIRKHEEPKDGVIFLQSLLGRYFSIDLSDVPKGKLPFVVRRDTIRENIEQIISKIDKAKDFLSSL